MGTFMVFIFLVVLGFTGMVFFIVKRLIPVRPLCDIEAKLHFEKTAPFFDFIKEGVITPFEKFMGGVVQPFLLKFMEKNLRRFRILVLKIESFLHRISDYFRGRRIAIKNGNGNAGTNCNGNGNSLDDARGKNIHFWNELHKTKDKFHANKDKGGSPR